MRLLGACVALLALVVTGLTQTPPLAQAPPQVEFDQVLTLLHAMPADPGLKKSAASALREVVQAGWDLPLNVHSYLDRAGQLAPGEANDALRILTRGLEAGLSVDRLLSRALLGWRRERPWGEILGELSFRLGMLLAAQEVVMEVRVAVEICPATIREVVAEVGWAVADHIAEGGSPADGAGMTSRVRSSLSNLRSVAPCERTVDAVLEALTPDMVAGIVARALAQEGR